MQAPSTTYAITAVTSQRRPLFENAENADLLLETLLHYRDEGRYGVHGFALLPEHLHLLLTPAPGHTLEKCVQCIKAGFAYALRDRYEGEIWQPGFREHKVLDAADFKAQRANIASFPVQRHLHDHLYVHTHHPAQMDPTPDHLYR